MQLMEWGVAKQFKGRALELDGDLRVTLCQTLACAEIKRHSRPAPVVDVELQGYERFGPRFRSDSGFRSVSGNSLRTQQSRPILSAHAAQQHIVRAQRLNRMQHFGLLVSHRVRLKRYRRFHGGQAEQL